MKPNYLITCAITLCALMLLVQSAMTQEKTVLQNSTTYTFHQPGNLLTANMSFADMIAQNDNYNKVGASSIYTPQISFANYKPRKKYEFDDYRKLFALEVSLDVTKTKYKNDYYKRKALDKLNFEAILLIAPDVLPNPFPATNSNDVSLYQADTVKQKARSYFSFRTGLRFSARGDKEVDGDDSYKTYVYYLNLPVYALYNYQAAGGTFFGGLGPYFGYGLFGKFIDKVSGETTKEKIKFGKDQSGIRHGDFGIGLVAGYIYGPFLFHLSYDFGLSNIFYDKDDKASTRAFGISVGYFLN